MNSTVTSQVLLAQTDDDIRRCYDVMSELRPHVQREEFLARVKRQKGIANYELAFVLAEDQVQAVAGFRVTESLAWGKYLYVDDLVSRSDARSKGHGGKLFDWLVAYAKQHDCDQFHLDSAVHRFRAHRFYLLKRMNIESHHFGMKLKD
jgi:GNAT superfamily N-acetyltransferase